MALSQSQKKQEADIDEFLEDARIAALSDWEIDFVDSLISRRKTFGIDFVLTSAQRDKLEEIVWR